jgi:hypothetical protein
LNETHLDAKRVLQSPLKHGEDGVHLKINDEIWTASKHPERALAYVSAGWDTRIRCRCVPFSDAGSVGDGKDDDLKGMPWPSSLHTLVRDIVCLTPVAGSCSREWSRMRSSFERVALERWS